jgi:CDP-diglyceride synthetase
MLWGVVCHPQESGMPQWLAPIFAALVMVGAANAVPVIVAKVARDRWSWPIDGGYTLRDGQRLLGAHKTWRGLLSGIAATALVGMIFGLPIWVGGGFGAVSLAADAASSMFKRRLRLKSGTEVIGLDQLGEAALPLVIFARPLSLDLGAILLVIAMFVVLDLATVALRHRPWLS